MLTKMLLSALCFLRSLHDTVRVFLVFHPACTSAHAWHILVLMLSRLSVGRYYETINCAQTTMDTNHNSPRAGYQINLRSGKICCEQEQTLYDWGEKEVSIRYLMTRCLMTRCNLLKGYCNKKCQHNLREY